jgi:PucR C-terminal helix-turn-helix domain
VTRVVDLWRALDPEARMVSGSTDELQRTVRSALRTRTASPHLPASEDAYLLIADAPLLRMGLAAFVLALGEAGRLPGGILVAGSESRTSLEPTSHPLPVLASAQSAAELMDRAAAYLADEPAALGRLSEELRLAAAEAALAEPVPGAPGGLIAARLRRGVAIAADGVLLSLHPRPAGRALAARFAATHARLFSVATADRRGDLRQKRDGLWLLERRIRSGASVWIFDDAPLAQVDAVGAEALTVTLRALLRRPPPDARSSRQDTVAVEAAAHGRFGETLLAVARSNGRIAPAARALGVHRNTVLYRLRAVRAQGGPDPRLPADALRILREAGADR